MFLALNMSIELMFVHKIQITPRACKTWFGLWLAGCQVIIVSLLREFWFFRRQWKIHYDRWRILSSKQMTDIVHLKVDLNFCNRDATSKYAHHQIILIHKLIESDSVQPSRYRIQTLPCHRLPFTDWSKSVHEWKFVKKPQLNRLEYSIFYCC